MNSSMNSVSPLMRAHTVWRPAQGVRYEVNLPRAFREINRLPGEKHDAPLLKQAGQMILGVLNTPNIKTAFTREEIDRVFYEEIISRNPLGSEIQGPGEMGKLKNINHWAHLLNNTVGVVISYVSMIEEMGLSSDFDLSDIVPQIQKALRLSKIMEDWIHYNRELMREVCSQVKE